MPKAALLRWLSLILLGLGLLRLFTFAAHQPLWAYANQYDMARTSACLGLWPARDGETPIDAAHASAPLTQYERSGQRGDACFPSTEVVVVAAAVWLDETLGADDAAGFRLGQLALWKALLACLVALSLHVGLRRHPLWQFGFAMGFTAVICDPFNLLFLGGLYTEFSALLGAWCAVGSLVILGLRYRQCDATFGLPALGLAVGLLALGASRMQHLLHPLALLLPAALYWHRCGGEHRGRSVPHGWLLLAPAGLATLLVIGLQMNNQARQESIAEANRLNSLFAAILPASDAPRAMIQRIGLPEHCAQLNHVSWYLQRGHQPLQECPELVEYSRIRVMFALAAEPVAVLRLLGRGLLHGSAWRLPYLGEVADESYAKAPRASISGAVASLGFEALVLLWALPLLACLSPAWRLLRGRGGVLDLLAVVLATWVVLTWLASLLGDGYSELTRHLHLAQNALLALWLWLPCWLVTSAVRLLSLSPRLRFRAPILAAGCSIGLLLVALCWSRLPMATGQVRAPNGDAPVRHEFAVDGWVLAASPVTAIRARIGDAQPIPLQLLPAEEALRQFFPADDGGLVARFEGRVSWPIAEGDAATLRVEARDGGSAWQEFNAVLLRLESEASTSEAARLRPALR